MAMYSKDKTNRITLRLTNDQMDFVAYSSTELGISPSDYLRMIINISIASCKTSLAKDGRDYNALVDGARLNR